MMALIVAVDPGSKGAIAVLRCDGSLVEVRDMPMRRIEPTKTAKGRWVVDSYRLRSCFDVEFLASMHQGQVLEAVVVERAWPRPEEKAPQAFRLGQNHQAILTAAEMFARHPIHGEHPVVEIAPQRWKRVLGIRSAEDVDDRKRDQELQGQALAVAQWPGYADRFKAISRSGRIEAPLIGLAWLIDNGYPVELAVPA